MSVLVKGMEMPKCCRECPFENYNSYTGQTFCNASLRVLAIGFGVISFDGRHSSCPLVALPDKHGRLVDADAMCNDLATVDIQYQQMIEWCISVTEAQPTVIEAEDE